MVSPAWRLESYVRSTLREADDDVAYFQASEDILDPSLYFVDHDRCTCQTTSIE